MGTSRVFDNSIYRYYASFIDNNQLNIVLELAEAGDMSRMIKVFFNEL